MSAQTLANIVWHCLSGPHADFSTGTRRARRYLRGFSPILGFADAEHPDLSSLEPYCELGESLYCGGGSGPVPDGWHVEQDAMVLQMIWEGAQPVADPSAHSIRLGPSHVPQMIGLTALTHPGPFGERTIELGEYYGIMEGDRLVAMAGERFIAGRLREISGVCTHPEFQGRGLARHLVRELVRRQLLRDQTPFLHVMTDNLHARRLYERLGFRPVQELAMRVVSRVAG